MTINANDVIVPLDFTKGARESYIANYLAINRNSRRLVLIIAD